MYEHNTLQSVRSTRIYKFLTLVITCSFSAPHRGGLGSSRCTDTCIVPMSYMRHVSTSALRSPHSTSLVLMTYDPVLGIIESVTSKTSQNAYFNKNRYMYMYNIPTVDTSRYLNIVNVRLFNNSTDLCVSQKEY